MSVEDGAYARLVRMHAAKRQTFEASEGLASFAEKRAANWVAVTVGNSIRLASEVELGDALG